MATESNGWTLKGPPKTLRVTKRLADEWATLESVRNDRPLSERRLTVYRAMVASRQFRPVLWARAACEETGETYRVNGKHTSTLFSSIDLSANELYAVVEDYVCPTLEDVARLYSTFDNKIQSRNAGDVNRSFAAVIPELADLPARYVNLLVGGLNYWANPTQPAKETAAERAERLFDEVEFGVWLADLMRVGVGRGSVCDGGSVAPLERVPVVAAIRAAYAKSRSAAREFWTLVRDETGQSPASPDRRLAKYLSSMRVNNANGAHKPIRFKADAREFYVKCVHAWNAWRRGEASDLKYYPSAKLPAPV